MKARSKLVSFSLGILFPFIASAQDATQTTPRPTLETVVVTATKTEEKLSDIPYSVIVLDSIDIEEAPAGDLGELIADEPGLDWRTYGDYGGAAESIQIRGMESKEVLIMLNGVSLNSPSLGSADIGGLPLNGIERVEITKGTGSSLYGSGATAGTVNLITKGPRRDQPTLNLKKGVGSYNTSKLAVEQGMFVFEDFGYFLTASRRETDGQRANSDLDQKNSSLKLVYDKGAIFNLTAYGFDLNRKFGNPGVQPPSDTTPYYINDVKFYDNEAASLLNWGENKDKYLILEARSQLNPALKIRLKRYNSDMESVDSTRYLYNAGAGSKTWVINEVNGTEGNIELTPSDSLKLLIGMDKKKYNWKYRKVGLDTNGDETTLESAVSQSVETSGFFGEIQYRMSHKVKTLFGARREDHSVFGAETSPNFGIIFDLKKKKTLKITHGRHFNAPTLNDLFWPEDEYLRGNPDLRPQTGWHSDITLTRGTSKSELFVSLTYFQWNVDDKIVWAPNENYLDQSGDEKSTPINLDKRYGRGWEATFNYNPTYSFGLAVCYTYTEAEDKTQTVTRGAMYTPEHRLKTSLSYRSGFGLKAKATFRYVSERDYYRSETDTIPTDTLEAYVIADLKLQQRIRENWLISFRINNFFDASYNTYMGFFTYGDETTIYSQYPGSGRSVALEISYKY